MTANPPPHPIMPPWLAGLTLALLCLLLQLFPQLSPQLNPQLHPNPWLWPQAMLWLKAIGLQLHHTSWAHLALNLAGLGLLVWGFLPTCGPRVLACALAWGAAWVAAWVLWVEPLTWYMGLSGALHAVLATALVLGVGNCIQQQSQQTQTIRPLRLASLALGLIALGLLVKLGLEWQANQEAALGARAVDAWLNAPVAYEAHRGGALGGLVLGLGLTALGWPKRLGAMGKF